MDDLAIPFSDTCHDMSDISGDEENARIFHQGIVRSESQQSYHNSVTMRNVGAGLSSLDNHGNGISNTAAIATDIQGMSSLDIENVEEFYMHENVRSRIGRLRDLSKSFVDLKSEISVFSDSESAKEIQGFGDLDRKIPSMKDLGKTVSSFDLPVLGEIGKGIQGLKALGRNIPSWEELGEHNPVSANIKDIQGLGDLGRNIPGLSYFGKDAQSLVNLGTNVSSLVDNENIPALPNFEKYIPESWNLGNIPSMGHFGRDIASLDFNKLGKDHIPVLDDLTKGEVNLDHIKDSVAQIGDAVESLTGISPEELVSSIPGSDLLGFGADGSSDDDSNDFESVLSDIRSIGGDVVDLISDSKQFFTQLGALVGVFGTLVNTGSNAIDDYHNGKVASSIFNFILLISVQMPTISAMLFVFLKDKVHLSFKGFAKIKEDLKELVDDLDSLMGSEDEEGKDSEDSSIDADLLTKEEEDNNEPSETSDYEPLDDITLPVENVRTSHNELNDMEEIYQSVKKRKSDQMTSSKPDKEDTSETVVKGFMKRKRKEKKWVDEHEEDRQTKQDDLTKDSCTAESVSNTIQSQSPISSFHKKSNDEAKKLSLSPKRISESQSFHLQGQAESKFGQVHIKQRSKNTQPERSGTAATTNTHQTNLLSYLGVTSFQQDHGTSKEVPKALQKPNLKDAAEPWQVVRRRKSRKLQKVPLEPNEIVRKVELSEEPKMVRKIISRGRKPKPMIISTPPQRFARNYKGFGYADTDSKD